MIILIRRILLRRVEYRHLWLCLLLGGWLLGLCSWLPFLLLDNQLLGDGGALLLGFLLERLIERLLRSLLGAPFRILLVLLAGVLAHFKNYFLIQASAPRIGLESLGCTRNALVV